MHNLWFYANISSFKKNNKLAFNGLLNKLNKLKLKKYCCQVNNLYKYLKLENVKVLFLVKEINILINFMTSCLTFFFLFIF